MKRIGYLIPLSREHHASLVLAKKCIETAQGSDQQAIDTLCSSVVEQFPDTWDKHFQTEEETVFPVVRKFYPDLQALCVSLIDEHQQMRVIYKQLQAGNRNVLGSFGQLLRSHTRKEERELFPLINNTEFSGQAESLLALE